MTREFPVVSFVKSSSHFPHAKCDSINGTHWSFVPGTTIVPIGEPFKRPDGLWEMRFSIHLPADEPHIVSASPDAQSDTSANK